jgi:carbamoyltransferase
MSGHVHILGINAYHGDSSACIVLDGRLIAAAEEERFCRVKHWAGFPARAIGYCLAEAGIDPSAIDHVAINTDPAANMLGRIAHVLTSRPDPRLLLDRLRNRRRRASVQTELERLSNGAIRGRVHHVEHHLAHLSSCFLVSPFEEAAVVSVDGFGDFSSAAWGVGRGNAIDIQERVHFPHSLGVFYQALTQYLGFPHYGDEYKVMGLAPYGRPAFLEEMRKIVLPDDNGGFSLDLAYFRHHRERVAYQWSGGAPHVGDLFSSALEQLLGPRRAAGNPLTDRHRDIAHSTQAMYEEAFFHLIGTLQARTGQQQIALAGGCAMNSVANGKIRRRTPFRKVYVQPAAGDAGGAIGAAFAVWQRLGGPRSFALNHAYWGPQYDTPAIDAMLAQRMPEIRSAGCSVDHISDVDVLCRRTAASINESKVIGWFQGRMEWGPRALGNRSILADPRRADMKDILNRKIKRRESFRPFAPSVLAEHVDAWFEEDDNVPFMMQVFQIRHEKRSIIPAVAHVDGSGRLQTVSRATNPRYHRLLECFHALSGVPMLLNTSFNENEPIVCRPEEALDCFLRTKMDLLVIGDVVIERRATAVTS